MDQPKILLVLSWEPKSFFWFKNDEKPLVFDGFGQKKLFGSQLSTSKKTLFRLKHTRLDADGVFISQALS